MDANIKHRFWFLSLALCLLAVRPASPATIPVTTTLDNDVADADCSLREAIVAANLDAGYNGCPAGSGADRIVFSLTLPTTIALTIQLPTITTTLLLQGPGADLLTVDGQGAHRILRVDSASGGAWLGVEELTLAHGFSDLGGGAGVASGDSALFRRVVFLENHASNGGGGLYIENVAVEAGDLAGEAMTGSPAPVVIDECWFAGNVAEGVSGGGGLHATGALARVEIDRTTFSDNVASRTSGTGGAIRSVNGALTIRRSTFSGNAAYFNAGAIQVQSIGTDATLSLHDSTVTQNSADADLSGHGQGGGLELIADIGRAVTLEISNSIVAGNLEAGSKLASDVFFPATSGATLVSAGFNLIGTNFEAETYFVAGLPNADGDWVGTSAAPIDPELDPLADYGGFAPTHRPLVVAGSPVIDQGSCPGSSSDQRGRGSVATHLRVVDRPPANAGDGCDIGAVERGGADGAEPVLFLDGFEGGNTLLWSSESP